MQHAIEACKTVQAYLKFQLCGPGAFLLDNLMGLAALHLQLLGHRRQALCHGARTRPLHTALQCHRLAAGSKMQLLCHAAKAANTNMALQHHKLCCHTANTCDAVMLAV